MSAQGTAALTTCASGERQPPGGRDSFDSSTKEERYEGRKRVLPGCPSLGPSRLHYRPACSGGSAPAAVRSRASAEGPGCPGPARRPKTVSTEAAERQHLEGGSGPGNAGVKHIGSDPLPLAPAAACAARGHAARQESDDSPRWRSPHMHSPCRSGGEGLRRLWDKRG